MITQRPGMTKAHLNQLLDTIQSELQLATEKLAKSRSECEGFRYRALSAERRLDDIDQALDGHRYDAKERSASSIEQCQPTEFETENDDSEDQDSYIDEEPY